MPMIFRSFYKSRLLFLVLIIAPLLSLADVGPGKLQFDKTTEQATVEILKDLSTQHYQKTPIDDQFSTRLLHAYLENLDPAKIIFTADDIKEFDKYSTQLDDQLPEGNLDAISTIYNRYYQRHHDLLEHTLKDISRYTKPYPDPSAVLDLDRKTASWPANLNDSINLWDKRVYNEALTLKLSGKNVDSIPDLLRKRYEDRLRRLENVKPDDVYEIFATALTSLYDPHTDWMSPKAEENFKISMSLSLQGIGAVLQMEEEKTKVVSLVTGGPATKSGQIHPGDFIIGVGQGESGDMEDVIGWRLDEVVQKIRGDKGSYVRLQVEDVETKIQKTVVLQRDEVKLEDQAAKSTVIEIPSPVANEKPRKIGIINIPAFYMDFDAYRKGDPNYRSTTHDVRALLAGLKSENVDGVVLDLRNDGGGSLSESKTLTNLFIDQGPVVQTRYAADKPVDRNSLRATLPAFYTGPILVLINHLSASATEIFAGAIQDYHRGLIVGEQSFGKGTVQAITDISYGQLKITTAKFYRVSGDSTQHRGVLPDIQYPSLFDFKVVGESALDNALPWDQIRPVPHLVYDDPDVYLDALEKKHLERMENSPDYQALLKRIAFANEHRDIKVLSLDEQKRLAERQKDNQSLLDIANTLRIQKGQVPFKSYDEMEKDDADRVASSTAKTTIDVDNDFLLRESAQILSDLIDTERSKIQLTTQNNEKKAAAGK
jgi:carboxyl-terminal processing protease